ncbi:hypothetical protein CALVIDRAFT_566974 [Calocera viscosa TUFC12733]|uniref:Uncharacterized protein n=1 Tax=Calocera viscosa (strain TUFC12733) TaxID=1330018 RepID=A0A167IQV0_CALVF|nr:hypothetical protein CALVIDRAFT_566974 [Calocera viscosa TUFC12733]
MQVHDDNLCYIERLPFELLSFIFDICEQDYGDEWRRQPHDRHRTSTAALCSVSTHWRDVAFGTPTLWKTVCIRGPKTMERALAWFERSQSIGLDVSFSFTNWDDLPMVLVDIQPYLSSIMAIRLDGIVISELPQDFVKFLRAPNILRRLRLSKITLPSSAALVQLMMCCTSLVYLDVASCSLDEGWMSPQDVDASRTHWFTLDHLEEIVFPPNSLTERLRRLLIAPRLRRVSFVGANFLPSSPNELVIDVGNSPGLRIPLYLVFTLWLFVPEVESLTLVYFRDPEASEDHWDYVMALHGIVGRYAVRWSNYPLPSASMPHDEWIQHPQIMLPRLRLLKLHGVSPNLHLSMLPERQKASSAGRRPDPLQKVIVSGQQEPKDWHRVAEILRAQGVVVESEFGEEKDLRDASYGLPRGSI